MTRLDAIHALLLSPFVLCCLLTPTVLAMAYVFSVERTRRRRPRNPFMDAYRRAHEEER